MIEYQRVTTDKNRYYNLISAIMAKEAGEERKRGGGSKGLFIPAGRE